MKPTTTCEPEPLAVDVRQMARMVPFGVRTLRRMDASGRIPSGFKVGGRKLWRVSDLTLWASWGFPERTEFECKVKNLHQKLDFVCMMDNGAL